jgi:carbonic anhydrase/acetyltransferase-like protein (isoleucine patch superfamily)
MAAGRYLFGTLKVKTHLESLLIFLRTRISSAGLPPPGTIFLMTHAERLACHLGKTPDIRRAVFVAPNATINGDVVLAPLSSVFYGAVLRGDIARIVVGEGTNIQDNAIVHLADDGDAVIGAWCTIGHGAIVHACTIEDECLIGMGATVLDRAHIGARSTVGANALVKEDFICPPGSLVIGVPAKVVRQLTLEEQAGLRRWAEKYVEVAKAHAAHDRRGGRA